MRRIKPGNRKETIRIRPRIWKCSTEDKDRIRTGNFKNKTKRWKEEKKYQEIERKQ